ncbi:MAG: hypothetical protein H6737_30855 [Alphaproteobacteria bacterium]|nr:hypothetical protein [Alphaproteobacteria bacterium]
MWLALALLGCENPISNELFYADEEFLAVLPSQSRLGFSSLYANTAVQPGDDPLLVAGFDAAAELDEALTIVTTVGDVLRSTPPLERSDTHRTWGERSIAAPDDVPTDLWWIRATIVRAAPGADFTWTIEGAPSADGPWEIVGSGRHDPDGIGTVHWDFAAMGAALGVEVAGELEADYDETGADREVAFTLPPPAGIGLPAQYHLAGRTVFGWTGELALTTDAEAWPGAAQIFLDESHAGRGHGIVQRPDGEVAFQTCWNAEGAQVFSLGDVDFPAVGAPADCPVPDVFAEP